QIAGDPAAGFIGTNEGQASVGCTADELILGMGVLAPLVNEREFERQIAQAIAGAAAYRAMKIQNPLRHISAVRLHEFADAGFVVAAGEIVHQCVANRRHIALALRGALAPPGRARPEDAEYERQEEPVSQNQTRYYRKYDPGHLHRSRFMRATNSMGLKG